MLVRAGSVNAKLMTSVAAERTAQWASQAQAANSTTPTTTQNNPVASAATAASSADSEVEKSSVSRQNGTR